MSRGYRLCGGDKWATTGAGTPVRSQFSRRLCPRPPEIMHTRSALSCRNSWRFRFHYCLGRCPGMPGPARLRQLSVSTFNLWGVSNRAERRRAERLWQGDSSDAIRRAVPVTLHIRFRRSLPRSNGSTVCTSRRGGPDGGPSVVGRARRAKGAAVPFVCWRRHFVMDPRPCDRRMSDDSIVDPPARAVGLRCSGQRRPLRRQTDCLSVVEGKMVRHDRVH